MTDHIQINDVAPRVQYLADGVQSAFTFPFAIFADTDLEVWLDETPQSSGFSISGAGISTGGTALFAVPPTSGTRVTLRRRLSIRRTTDYQADGLIRAKTLNDEMDYQVAALQQVAEVTDRSVRRSATSSSLADLTLPEPAANRSLKWNADGSGLVNSSNDPDAAGDATAAAAQAVAAAAQAVSAKNDMTVALAGLESPLAQSANLADLENNETARANLGVPSLADIAVNARIPETAIALDDLALIHDASAMADRKVTIGNVLKAVNLLTTDTTPDKAADYVMTWDNSAGDVRKVLLSGVGGSASWEHVHTLNLSGQYTVSVTNIFVEGYDYLMCFDSMTCAQMATLKIAPNPAVYGANYISTISGIPLEGDSAIFTQTISNSGHAAPYVQMNTSSNDPAEGSFLFLNPNSSRRKTIIMDAVGWHYYVNTSSYRRSRVSGATMVASTTPWTGFYFFASDGLGTATTTGNIITYRRKRSA